MSQSLTGYTNGAVGDTASVVKSAQAWYFLALTAHLNPSATSSSGVSVVSQVLAHYRNVISGGKEPTCSNPLYGWGDNSVAQATLMMKNTPAVWNSLTSTEQTKADWLMKALAIAVNWGFNDQNNFRTGLGNGGNFSKTNNPNFCQGYLGVEIACSQYFGATALNAVFSSFRYNTYINQFNSYGWTNIVSNWTKTGQSMMENGGSDTFGGSGVGVKVAFVYQGVGASDPNGIYYQDSVASTAANAMYDKVVSNTGDNGLAYIIASGSSSPVLGQTGMCHEFASTDSGGVRSDALYSYEGWMNSLVTRASMKALGVWGGTHQLTVESRMNVGSSDLIYKLTQGYHGSYLGQFRDIYASDANLKGYLYTQEEWLTYVSLSTPSTPTGLSASAGNGQVTLSWSASSGATSYSLYRGTSPGGESAALIKTGLTGTSVTDTGLVNGTAYYYEVAAVNSVGTSGLSSEASATPAGPVEGPYSGTVQAENYDTGGQGVAYNITSTNGSANSYRSDGVDLETTTDTGGGYDLGWTSAGQWFKYTVDVAAAGTYTVTYRVANGTTSNGSLHIQDASGTNLSGSIAAAPTGGWQTWTTVTGNIALPAGQQVLTVSQDTGNFNINWIGFALQSSGETPYGGTAAAIPGTVQTENYDTGGEGVGYHVTSTNGSANSYRSDGVDLETTTDTGGYDLGWSAAGQWFRYTVNVASSGTYTASFRVANGTTSNGSFHLQNASGANLSGTVTVAPTGGWQTWTTVTANVTLPAGQQVLEFYEDTGGYNVNSMSFAAQQSGSTGGACTGIAAWSSNGVSYNVGDLVTYQTGWDPVDAPSLWSNVGGC